MARVRRSARLASATKPPASPTASLEPVKERDEQPKDEKPPKKSQDPVHNAHADSPRPVRSSPAPQTPATSSPVKPPMSEMHPGKFHTTTAPPSSALHLGFADIKDKTLQSSPTVELANRTAAAKSAATAPTSSATKPKAGLPSSPFTFRVHGGSTSSRNAGTGGLSARAQQMMDEIREDAMRIKADLVARQEQDRLLDEAENNGRRIAKATGRAGRFSAAHMAEFKKMDSIENHPSAFRAQHYQQQQQQQQQAAAAGSAAKFATPLPRGVKRTQSKANLNDSESVRLAAPKISASSATFSSSAAPAYGPVSATNKANLLFPDAAAAAPPGVKRVRQRLGDDASSSRPVSRDASFIPRPATAGKDSVTVSVPHSHTALGSLMTPTKSSTAKSAIPRTQAGGSLRSVPSGILKKPVTTSNLVTEQKAAAPVRTPGRFDRVKSILRGQRFGNAAKSKSALPMPSGASIVARTPSQLSLDKPLPAVPATTPSRKLVKRVVFTPDAKKATVAAVVQNSPSPLKSGIPRSKTFASLADIHYPRLDSVMDEHATNNALYPDLSASLSKGDDSTKEASVETAGRASMPGQSTAPPAPAVPGTFTFRSDHTIRFGSVSPNGFGASRGQASLRHVRPSIMPASGGLMPGSFPSSVVEFSGVDGGSRGNKENRDPQLLPAVKHGLENKKRHRADSDDEEERLPQPLPAVKHGLENKKRHRADSDDEEECRPQPLPAVKHGLENKKRHRAGPDEDEDDESDARAAKKRRQEPVPEGEAILAPRARPTAGANRSSVFGGGSARKALLSPSRRTPVKPSQIPGVSSLTPTPIKKKTTLSLSRLNMLARPKMRR